MQLFSPASASIPTTPETWASRRCVRFFSRLTPRRDFLLSSRAALQPGAVRLPQREDAVYPHVLAVWRLDGVRRQERRNGLSSWVPRAAALLGPRRYLTTHSRIGLMGRTLNGRVRCGFASVRCQVAVLSLWPESLCFPPLNLKRLIPRSPTA